ncbi:protein MIZU-KUSSEI 1 [Prosopis cineraria]|uniref:protein MIZU-KUSSEI 1 n=1 Tax=Prosopis cineraria TaxID=364024 RepID=UPI00240F89DE|nr:protein MIZU-KUSSEI 1 [Prosopis cineraria]
MNTIMAKSPHDSSFSFSRRYFHFTKKLVQEDDDDHLEEQVLTVTPLSSHHFCHQQQHFPSKINNHSVSRFKSAFTLFTRNRSLHQHRQSSLVGTRVVGTLFGNRRGRVHIAFQEDLKSLPPFLIELPTPTSLLVREMASGTVRIALECDKEKKKKKKNRGGNLVEEPVWRSYCNGRKCGQANRVECGEEEWKIMKAVEPISMGAGVIPATYGGSGDGEGEVMYMRARFERVVGSKDSEAYYLMNPDGSAGPELSVYLLRV